MSRLARDGTAEPVLRDQILRRERGQGNIHFPRSADHEQDWQPYPVDPYCCYMCDHTIALHTYPVISTCPRHTNSGCEKERRIFIGPWGPAKAAPVWNYLEVYWPCAGGLSAVNAIGTQLRDPINSGLTRWRMAV